MPTVDVCNPLLFEVAFEAANKVGGIYTVLKTKALVTVKEYGDSYTLLGPLNPRSAPAEVESLEPSSKATKAALAALSSKGVNYLYGRWLIEGAPSVLLFDLSSVRHYVSEWKGDLWATTSIPTPEGDADLETNDAVAFGYAVAWFFEEFVKHEPSRAIVAHFHEWLAGVGLILSVRKNLGLATIFTTHATLLGRYLCAGGGDFYNNVQFFHCDEEAGKRGIYHRYSIEKAAAHLADVFTTVSNITGYEAEHLLKRRPDGITPNGLNIFQFSATHEFQNLHAKNKEKIHEFVKGHFYGHTDFDLDSTLYFFTAGRYEYKNKGIDMYINALKRLNDRLRAANSTVTVVAFIILPAKTHSYTVESLKAQAVIKQLRDTVRGIENNIGHRLFEAAARGTDPNDAVKLTDEEKVILKRRTLALKRETLPSIVTHNMADSHSDPVLCELRRLELFNRPEDRVKIVFHPEFLCSNNPLIGLDYDDFVRGCHLGVFPSYYEPWGYTPAECTVMGVPSVTSNLSGFGCFMEDSIENPSDYGIYIVDRRLKSGEESIDQLAEMMFSFCCKTRRQRINQRNRTERLSDLLDWNRMNLEYVRARDLALRRKWPREFEDCSQEEEQQPEGTGKIPPPLPSAPPSPRSRPVDVAEVLRGVEDSFGKLELDTFSKQ